MRAEVDPASAFASSALVLALTIASSDMANTPLSTTSAMMMARSVQGNGVTPRALAQKPARASRAMGLSPTIRSKHRDGLFNQGQGAGRQEGAHERQNSLSPIGRHGILQH
jgi:hypothetical protein